MTAGELHLQGRRRFVAGLEADRVGRDPAPDRVEPREQRPGELRVVRRPDGLCDDQPLAPGKEEYLDSEKFEIKHWEIDRADSLRKLIARVNQIRSENPAFRANHNLRFHKVDNDQLIAFSKSTPDLANQVLVVINLDPHHTQAGIVDLPLEELSISHQQPFQVHDLLTDSRYLWHGERNYIELNPQIVPASIFVIRRRVRTEQDFDYYL